jgi:hypothetical protein
MGFDKPHDRREPCLFYLQSGPPTRASLTRQAHTMRGPSPHRPRSFLRPYQDARSQGPVDCSTAPVAKKSWATAMA